MFPAQLHAVLLPLLLLATVFAGVAAQSDQAVALDFSDVIFNPPEVWHSALSNECGPGGTDHYTVQMNASAQFNFVGTPHPAVCESCR
ncbi:uncharacterized protein PHACADRAFT_261244 [Phanerochaete carnosa HHB-10118-sp]|uniref:Uncharacterized protein n=1 Tax=Phanerochaete carnosa (strain HHB-10118-sp) TaxID=650164 RepID=K5VMG7_PHACS|nr:uncharacterized protein PHACADRAFT_261244 [Phanerochaete carnosa HHB-10118-sp]EKM52663.1 hypothetical protein PHACADRAFT_261244 [Phanerochaete carnosa HHB-10118-sp]